LVTQEVAGGADPVLHHLRRARLRPPAPGGIRDLPRVRRRQRRPGVLHHGRGPRHPAGRGAGYLPRPSGL